MPNYDQQEQQQQQQQSQQHKPDSSISSIRQPGVLDLFSRRQKRPHLTPLLIPDEDCTRISSTRWANPRRFHFSERADVPFMAEQFTVRPGSPAPPLQSPSTVSDRSSRFRKMASFEGRLFTLQQECDNFHNYVSNRLEELASDIEAIESPSIKSDSVTPISSNNKPTPFVLKGKLAQIAHQMKGLTYSPRRKPRRVTVESDDVYPPISSCYPHALDHVKSPADQGDDKENVVQQINAEVAMLTLTAQTEKQRQKPQHASDGHPINSRFMELFSPPPRLDAIRSKVKREKTLPVAGPGFNIVTGQGDWNSIQTPCNSPIIEACWSPIAGSPKNALGDVTSRYTPSWVGGATSPINNNTLDIEWWFYLFSISMQY